METKEQLRAQIRRLKSQIQRFREQLLDFKNQTISAGRHQRNHTGFKGETFLLHELQGAKSSDGTYDLIVRGKKLEVKTSLCRNVDSNREEITRRWTWHRPFGSNNKNKYDYLLLLGDMDTRLRKSYKQPTSKYVFFLLSVRSAIHLWRKQKKRIIQLTTNPNKQRSAQGKKLWQYELSLEELKRRLGVR